MAAALSVAVILEVNGVPLLPILAGCGAVAAWNLRKKNKSQGFLSFPSE